MKEPKSFLDGVKTPFAGLVKSYEVKDKDGKKHELSYLPWPRALALADRPYQQVRYFDGAPYFSVFGGAVVMVAQRIVEGAGEDPANLQDTFLPILDSTSKPIPIARVDSRDVTDTINRCRAKSVAAVNGVGLSLYSKGNKDTIAFIRALGVTPESDLSKVEPLIVRKEGKAPFIDWPSSLAAARITDPLFRWEILWHEVVDMDTGVVERKPVLKCGTGWAVTVKIVYRGEEHTEMLPIMGQMPVQTRGGTKELDHQPLLNPNVHDWNRAVMRCLVKAIALRSGYGLSVYASEDVGALHVDPLLRKASNDAHQPTEGAEAPQATATAEEVKDDPEQHAKLVAQVNEALTKKGRELDALLKWLGCQVKTLEELSIADLERAFGALSAPARAPTAQAA